MLKSVSPSSSLEVFSTPTTSQGSLTIPSSVSAKTSPATRTNHFLSQLEPIHQPPGTPFVEDMFAYPGVNASMLSQKLTATGLSQSSQQPSHLLTLSNCHTEEIANLQQRMSQLAQDIQCAPGLSSQIAMAMSNDLRKMSTEFNDITKKLRDERQQAVTERDNLLYAMDDKHRLMQNALSERDRAASERDEAMRDRDLLHSQVQNLNFRQRQTDDRINAIERAHQATIRELREQLQHKEEQLSAKRSLWIDNHPSSSMRHAKGTVAQDIFGTPTPNSGLSGRRPSPPSSIRPTNLNSQFAMMAAKNSGPGLTYATVTPPDESTKAVVPFKTLEQTAGEFREIFNEIFGKVEKWSLTYTSQIPSIAHDQKLSHDQEYWSFLMKCGFGQKPIMQESHNHTIQLLRDQESRHWFIMRVFVQYIVEEILASKNWLGFRADYDEELSRVEARLKERGLSVQERSELVTKRSNTISAIISAKDSFPAYRTFLLGKHTAKIRSRLGPLLDAGVPRSDAGREIGSIVVQAYDLSGKMYCSYKTFVTTFPEYGARYLDSSMVCRDAHIPDDNTLALQIRQMRLKLAMTPVITIRDDRVRAIEVKDVQESHVITMK